MENSVIIEKMALLNKIFSNRKRTGKTPEATEPHFLKSSRCIAPEFSKSRIRVLVFRECEWRGRKLLFDLESIKKIDVSSQNLCHKFDSCSKPQTPAGDKSGAGHIAISPDGIGYQYLRPRSDVKMLGEMVFGSVAMSYKGVAIKIHSIRSSAQLMFSKVFSAPSTAGRTKNDRESIGSNSLQSSLNESIPLSLGNVFHDSLENIVPADVHFGTYGFHSDDELEWLTSSSVKSSNGLENVLNVTSRSSPEGGSSSTSLSSLTRSGSYNSLHRRWLRTQNTSMEFGIKRKSDENVYTNEFSSNSRTKLAVSVVITLGNNEEEEKKLQSLFFSHIALIESYVNKLSKSVEQAYAHRKQFVHSVIQAAETLQQSLYDLYTAPRFPEPVWLSMMVNGTLQQPTCYRFIHELTNLLSLNDCKSTNFFMSTLLTAVLTHHLAWVPTVTPPDILPNQTFYAKHTAKWLDILAKFHPYNPLWVQLGDLYGALGNPCKLARTVIVGRNAELVKRILYCLTYFIRCSDVNENVECKKVAAVNFQCLSNSSTSSGSTLVGETGSTSLSTSSAIEDEVFNNKQNGNSVERQDGEGEDDDVFAKEVRKPLSTVVKQNHNRKPSRPSCKCGQVKSSCCCKLIQYLGGSSEDGASYLTSKTGFPAGSKQIRELNLLITKIPSKGLPGNIEQEIRDLHAKERCPRKKKGLNGRATFTIGDSPLHDIYKPYNNYEDSEEKLVCTCGKHLRVGEKVNGVVIYDTRLNVPTQLNGENLRASASKRDDFSSTRSDSGFYSCGPSLIDLNESITQVTESVEALKIDIPTVKVEHIRNVGKSLELKINNLSIDNLNEFETNEKAKNKTKSHRSFNYDRSNSMFDEYFDENVELKTLDDESFQKRLKIKREQWNKNANLQQKIGPETVNNCAQCESHFPKRFFEYIETESPGESKEQIAFNSSTLVQQESKEFFDKVMELPMPKSEFCYSISNSNDYCRGFGWSLAANFTDHYMTDFALQGTCQNDFGHQLLSDLKMAVQNPVLDETVIEAVALVADTDNWTVQIVSNKHGSVNEAGAPMGCRVMMSQLVANITDSLLQLSNLKMSPEFCLMHLEDRLQELYFKSRLLTEYTSSMQHLDVKSIVHELGVEPSDLPLLLGIASVHSTQNLGNVCLCT